MADPNQPDYEALRATVQQTTEALSALAGIMGPLALGLKTVVDSVSNLARSLNAGARAAEAANKALQLQAQASERAAAAAEKEAAEAYLKANLEQDPGLKKIFAAESVAAQEAAQKARAKADADAAKAADLVAAEGLSLGAVLNAVAAAGTAVVSVAKQTVGALNPVLLQQFDRAFANLLATIGVGLTPIISAGLGLFRDLAQQIAPLFIAMKPVVDQLAGGITDVIGAVVAATVPLLATLVPVVGLLLGVLRPLVGLTAILLGVFSAIIQVALIPFTLIVQALSTFLVPLGQTLSAATSGMQSVIQSVSKIIAVIGESIAALIDLGGLDIIVKEVTDAFKQFVTGLVSATYALAKLAGLDFAARLKKAFSNQSSLAQGPTSIKGLEQIGKDLAVASVTAVAGGKADATNADLLKAMEEIDKTNKDGFEKLLKERLGDTAGTAVSTAAKVWNGAPGYTTEDNEAVGVTSNLLHGASLGLLGKRKQGSFW